MVSSLQAPPELFNSQVELTCSGKAVATLLLYLFGFSKRNGEDGSRGIDQSRSARGSARPYARYGAENASGGASAYFIVPIAQCAWPMGARSHPTQRAAGYGSGVHGLGGDFPAGVAVRGTKRRD